MDKEIYIYSREGVERGIVFKGCYALISIRDPGSEKVAYRCTGGLVSVIELVFDDADPGGLLLPTHITLMSDEDADRIANFVKRYVDEVDGFVIHCEAGVSRSPATAAAIARYLKQPDREFWEEYQPNNYVYDRVCEALGVTSLREV